jgi:hypothetical protein
LGGGHAALHPDPIAGKQNQTIAATKLGV